MEIDVEKYDTEEQPKRVSASNLLPCPFCGKVKTLRVSNTGEDEDLYLFDIYYSVCCDASTPDGPGGCGAQGGYMPTEKEAVDRWNARAR